jgi:hypothetical protein
VVVVQLANVQAILPGVLSQLTVWLLAAYRLAGALEELLALILVTRFVALTARQRKNTYMLILLTMLVLNTESMFK